MGQRLVDIGNRRVGEQIVGFVVAGGIAPGKAGDRGGVVCAEAASGLEGGFATFLFRGLLMAKRI